MPREDFTRDPADFPCQSWSRATRSRSRPPTWMARCKHLLDAAWHCGSCASGRATSKTCFLELTGKGTTRMSQRAARGLHARNLEFLRDRCDARLQRPVAARAGRSPRPDLRRPAAGAVQGRRGACPGSASIETSCIPSSAPATSILHADRARHRVAIRKVDRHELDLLLDLRAAPRYWVNADSPKGYVVEKLLLETAGGAATRESVSGQAVRYVDWLLPGILGMNMMFSCLFGVGYVVVRYRKSGFLRRLSATPLRRSNSSRHRCCRG